MAYCKIWDVEKRTAAQVIDYVTNPLKCTVEREMESLMTTESVVGYATNSIKTENRQLVSGVNTEPWSVLDDFEITKKQWNNKSKKTCYHAVQSFMPGEITPELAHKLGVELAKKMWGDRFQVIVATHTNEAHIHNHFVINNISFVDGKQYYDNNKNLWRLRRESDKLCRANGLSVINGSENSGKTYYDWMRSLEEENRVLGGNPSKPEEPMEEEPDADVLEDGETDKSQGTAKTDAAAENQKVNPGNKSTQKKKKIVFDKEKPSNRKDMARMAVDKAIRESKNLTEFRRNLQDMGYVVDLNPNHKYWTIRSVTWERPMRMYRLGDDYTNERILERISLGRAKSFGASQFGTRHKTEGTRTKFNSSRTYKRRMYRAKGSFNTKRKITGFRALYIRYCFVLGVMPYNRNKQRRVIYYSPALREDLRKINRVTQKTQVLCKYKINTNIDLIKSKRKCLDRIDELLSIRRYIYKHNDGSQERLNQLTAIKQELRELQKEVSCLEEIEKECEDVKSRLQQGTRELNNINNRDERSAENEREWRSGGYGRERDSQSNDRWS